jgi:hypothetical protein
MSRGVAFRDIQHQVFTNQKEIIRLMAGEQKSYSCRVLFVKFKTLIYPNIRIGFFPIYLIKNWKFPNHHAQSSTYSV